MDYLAEWREADAAARELNSICAELGVSVDLVQARPHVRSEGCSVVWVRPGEARKLAQAVRCLIRQREGQC
ncbi:hypothetical protein [Streptomyces sp. SCSIO ZS0520]|uniref:hypothetical protein n=1 Tax=Streptomyces sp. SCSIO ZS0520 TaxID=2892996 RepID=UPI0021DB60D4|nr:hypothetical protein [Streptomyces sp. SCSIO ZS0520]